MLHKCCVSFCSTTSKKNKNLRFHRFAKKKEQKELWISKISRDKGDYFTVTGNTRVCSRHFREEDYTISEDGKGKRTALRKGAVPLVFQWTAKKAISEYFSKHRQTQKLKGEPILVVDEVWMKGLTAACLSRVITTIFKELLGGAGMTQW